MQQWDGKIPSPVRIGARESNLSKEQIKEFFLLIEKYIPPQILSQLTFEKQFMKTVGDRDKKTSLKTLLKTDFFTKELDQKLLNNTIDLALHSAKDLPDPMPEKLFVVAKTASIDPRDAIVYNHKLQDNPRIATSSIQREKNVLTLYPGALFSDIRGTIEERLNALDQGLVDGVVIAEAALIRLNLSHRKRVYLQGAVAIDQGRLALVARKDQRAIWEPIFSYISNKKVETPLVSESILA